MLKDAGADTVTVIEDDAPGEMVCSIDALPLASADAGTAKATRSKTASATLPTTGVYDRGVINAVHTLIYSDDPPATRAFLRDVLAWPFVEEPDVPGWLIFRTGPSELGVHPTTYTHEGTEYSHPLHHEIALMCDDIEATVAALTAKGAEVEPIENLGFGLAAKLRLPGAGEILVYEPRHPIAHGL
jgi:catechol 2,3-dioxygenase-like lactoylglutathione lyase family enzyme